MSEPKKPTTTRASKAKVQAKVKKASGKSAPQSKMVTGLVFLFTALCIVFAILVMYRYGV